jgi:hypothetical protein
MTQNLIHRELLSDEQRIELPAKRFGTGPLAEMPPHPQRRNAPEPPRCGVAAVAAIPGEPVVPQLAAMLISSY